MNNLKHLFSDSKNPLLISPYKWEQGGNFKNKCAILRLI